jgi:uncharacterized membrane protein YeiH
VNLDLVVDPVILRGIEITAILIAAFSGFAEAQKKGMDLVGIYTVAFITAFGGGTVRDILLDRRPLFWVEHQEYALLVFALSFLAFPLLRFFKQLVSEWALVITDAIGLGMFSVSSTALALQMGFNVFGSIMMGVLTGIFGGVLRDVICNEIPLILRDGKPYAVCAFAGCGLYILAVKGNMGVSLALWLAVFLVVALRLLAWRLRWKINDLSRSDDR